MTTPMASLGRVQTIAKLKVLRRVQVTPPIATCGRPFSMKWPRGTKPRSRIC